jgi:hypothetical protein
VLSTKGIKNTKAGKESKGTKAGKERHKTKQGKGPKPGKERQRLGAFQNLFRTLFGAKSTYFPSFLLAQNKIMSRQDKTEYQVR